MRNAILLIVTISLVIGGIAFYGAKTFAEATTREKETSIIQIDQLAHPQISANK
jgi:hypothetical protein